LSREKARIIRILNLLHRVWEKYPDLRFGQLLENLQVFPIVQTQACRPYMNTWGQEDDVTEEKLIEILKPDRVEKRLNNFAVEE